MTKYNGGEGSMNQEQGPSKGIFPSSLEHKGYHAVTTTPPIPETGRFTDERRIAFEPPERTAPLERPKIWDKEPPAKKPLIERLVNNLALRIVLAGGVGVIGARYAVNEAYQVPAVHQQVDNALERFGLKIVVPPIFDNKAEENILGKNNSFYVTPEEYKEKGPPTVEEVTSERRNITIPFPIRFNDGKEHVVSITKKNGGFEVSGDLKGGELLVPAKEENVTISGGGGNGGFAGIYKPEFSFSNFSSWGIGLEDGRGGRVVFIVTTGALQTAKDLVLQQDGPAPGGRGHIKGFAPIGTLLDNQPVFIAANIISPDGKMGLTRGETYIPTTSTGQAYVLK
ncbi:MAG: hypothetical protein Q7K26_06860 [bacterium]|nr:hypothetical protein [bacterium]